MKNLILSVLLAVFSILCGYSQLRTITTTPAYPKDEAIAILKDNYLTMYFQHPADTVATLDRFVETLNKIIPIGDGKIEAIKTQALAAVQKQTVIADDRAGFLNPQTEKFPSITWQIHSLPLTEFDNYIPLLAGNVDAVIRANFNDEDYALIYKILSDERMKVRKAYFALGWYFRRESPDKAYNIEAPLGTGEEIYLGKMFDHYNIR